MLRTLCRIGNPNHLGSLDTQRILHVLSSPHKDELFRQWYVKARVGVREDKAIGSVTGRSDLVSTPPIPWTFGGMTYELYPEMRNAHVLDCVLRWAMLAVGF